jgi:hypothetical protein
MVNRFRRDTLMMSTHDPHQDDGHGPSIAVAPLPGLAFGAFANRYPEDL